MEIAELIAQWHSGETLVVEPNIHQLPKKLTGLCTLAQLDEALATADVLVMLVDHSQFKVINGDNVHQQYVVDAKRSLALMRKILITGGCRVYWLGAGALYHQRNERRGGSGR